MEGRRCCRLWCYQCSGSLEEPLLEFGRCRVGRLDVRLVLLHLLFFFGQLAPVEAELGEVVAGNLAGHLDNEVEDDSKTAAGQKDDKPSDTESGRAGDIAGVHVESQLGHSGEDQDRRQEHHAGAELAEHAHDNVAKDHLAPRAGLNDKKTTSDEEHVTEGDFVEVEHADDTHAVVDIVADNVDPLEDQGNGDKTQLQGEAGKEIPLLDLGKATVDSQIADGNTNGSDLHRNERSAKMSDVRKVCDDRHTAKKV